MSGKFCFSPHLLMPLLLLGRSLFCFYFHLFFFSAFFLSYLIIMTVFWKTSLMVTNTEIHFLPVDECHTLAPSRDTMHLRLDGQVCFYRQLFCNDVKSRGCISWPVWLLRGINKTAWGPKPILMADLVYHLSCVSLGHLLMAQHCHFCLNVCFSPSMALHLPPSPSHPL